MRTLEESKQQKLSTVTKRDKPLNVTNPLLRQLSTLGKFKVEPTWTTDPFEI